MYSGIYQFNVEDVERFKLSVGRRAKHSNGQLVFGYCPYCDGGANKDRDTFAISMRTGQFECKRSSCGARGNMITLAKDFSNVFQISNEVSNYYNIDNSGISYKKFKDAHRITESKDAAVEYMKSRGISEVVCRKYEITTAPDQDNVIVFPFKDEEGALQFIKYRNTQPKEGQSKEWCIKGNYKKILFGMNHCTDFGTLVITEGQIDSLSLAEAGIKNAVSVPTGKNGFTWKPNVWNWLVKFDEIVVFGDKEGDTITLAKEISGFFPKRVRIVQLSDYHGYKDANEILQNEGKQALIDAVNNAEPVVSFRIKDLSDVERVDLSKMKAYPTGIESIDSNIGGGFHAGEVNILTGKCGEGKSTFASQIIARMIQNGLKCFCYSGELPDWMFKAWLDYQIGGTKKPSEGKLNAISEWYKKKCYIYDNSAVIDEEENLFDLIAQAIRDLGCKFILIDNLMTALEEDPAQDLFRQQSNFLTRLTKIAKGFDVIILLIAHPKKGTSNSNDSISGSGDITNRANIVLRYQRNPKDKDQSLVMITKNRTTGKLLEENSAIKVSYDDNSMRIYELDNNGGYKPYKEFIGFDTVDDFDDTENEEIPF